MKEERSRTIKVWSVIIRSRPIGFVFLDSPSRLSNVLTCLRLNIKYWISPDLTSMRWLGFLFYCCDVVNKISICGVAVISSPSVYDVCVFHGAVFGAMKLFAVLWFSSCLVFLRPKFRMLTSSIFGSFSGRLLSHVHGLSYKRALPVNTSLKSI